MCFVYPKSELTLDFDSTLAPPSVGAVKIRAADDPSTSELTLDPQPAEPEPGFHSEPKLNLAIDSNLLQMPVNSAWRLWYGTTFAQPAALRRVVAGNWDLATSQLAELQTCRQSLNRTVRSLSKNLASVELFIGSGWKGFVVDTKKNAANDVTLLDVSAPSIQGAVIDGQHRYTMVQQDIWDYLLCSARRTQLVLKQGLTLVRRARNFVSAVISILIKRLFRLAFSRFCSVCWERRRWFLCHTAHPPKTSRPAVAGLFLGACFGSRLA